MLIIELYFYIYESALFRISLKNNEVPSGRITEEVESEF
jgi:hypothetical protein